MVKPEYYVPVLRPDGLEEAIGKAFLQTAPETLSHADILCICEGFRDQLIWLRDVVSFESVLLDTTKVIYVPSGAVCPPLNEIKKKLKSLNQDWEALGEDVDPNIDQSILQSIGLEITKGDLTVALKKARQHRIYSATKYRSVLKDDDWPDYIAAQLRDVLYVRERPNFELLNENYRRALQIAARFLSSLGFQVETLSPSSAPWKPLQSDPGTVVKTKEGQFTWAPDAKHVPFIPPRFNSPYVANENRVPTWHMTADSLKLLKLLPEGTSLFELFHVKIQMEVDADEAIPNKWPEEVAKNKDDWCVGYLHVAPYVEGMELFSHVPAGMPERMKVLADVVKGMIDMWKRGYMHGDLYAKNIAVVPDPDEKHGIRGVLFDLEILARVGNGGAEDWFDHQHNIAFGRDHLGEGQSFRWGDPPWSGPIGREILFPLLASVLAKESHLWEGARYVKLPEIRKEKPYTLEEINRWIDEMCCPDAPSELVNALKKMIPYEVYPDDEDPWGYELGMAPKFLTDFLELLERNM